MAKTSQQQKKRLFGMTLSQIAVLLFGGLLTVVIMGFAAFLFLGKSTTGTWLSILSLANPSKAILGRWEKYIETVATPSQSAEFRIGCDFGYPQNIEFFLDGTYAGMAVALFSDLFVWQGGEYEILDDGRIKMQTRNGFAVYKYFIDEGKLVFIDDNECEFRYQHVSTTFTAINITASITDTVIFSSSPTWTTTPPIQPSPSRTKAPTWTLYPQIITPTRTRVPTWTALP